MLGCRLEDLLDHLGLSFRRKGKMLVGSCPIHGGRGPDAFNIYPDGHTVRGNWKCRSRQCHQEFHGTVIGLAWGVLSHERCNWQAPGDRRVSFRQVIDYLCDFIGTPLKDIKVDDAEVTKKEFAAQRQVLNRSRQPVVPGWVPGAIRRRMEVPAAYYLARGYRAETLVRYDVGLWRPGGDHPSPLAGRIAVPVYDEDHRRVLGVTARSPFERCNHCQQFHDPALPCPKEKAKEYVKWLNNEGFAKERYLYNWWFARQHIRDSKLVVLVEGPGDVWRLEEAGVHNAVAMFGNELQDPQQVLLERSGALTVVLFPHQDEAGQRSRRYIEQELGRRYRLYFRDLPAKDVGEMTVEDVQSIIVPFLDRLTARR